MVVKEKESHAVSELIGAILLVGLVITAMAIVAVLVLSNPPPEEVPHLNALAGNTSDSILLYHTGGDELKEEQTLIRINNNPDPIPHSEIYLKSDDGTVESSPWATTKTQWGVGKTLVIQSNITPQSVTVIYQGPTSQHLILSTSFAYFIGSNGQPDPGSECPSVTASFIGSPISGPIPLTVLFTDTSVSAAPIISRTWNFGDGNVNTTPNPTISHTYTSLGSYTVTLTTANECGNSNLATIPNFIVTSCPPVTASFTGSPTSGPIPFTVLFTDTSVSAAPIISRTWNFGDGNVNTTPNPTISHTYTSVGSYTVTLTTANECGQENTTPVLNFITGTNNFTVNKIIKLNKDTSGCSGKGRLLGGTYFIFTSNKNKEIIQVNNQEYTFDKDEVGKILLNSDHYTAEINIASSHTLNILALNDISLYKKVGTNFVLLDSGPVNSVNIQLKPSGGTEGKYFDETTLTYIYDYHCTSQTYLQVRNPLQVIIPQGNNNNRIEIKNIDALTTGSTDLYLKIDSSTNLIDECTGLLSVY